MSADTLSATAQLSASYKTKVPGYFAGARLDFIEELPHDNEAAILEIGCGSGETGSLALRSGRAGRYVGVELMQDAGARAKDKLTEVVIGDVERIDLDWQPATFDALILSEVLEHLREPGATLERLSRFVRPGATVLASSPNVAHWRVIRELIMGRFPKADQGVFDRTHLRWFTPSTFAAMFEEAGFRVEYTTAVTAFSDRTRLISKLTGGRFDHLFMTQIFLKARKV